VKTFRLSSLLFFGFTSYILAQEPASLVNFSHLDRLTEQIAFYGDTVSIVHVYANYPDYHWVDANDSGPEGIACVDDAARAAVVFLRYYELTHAASSLTKGRALLKFVMKMQAEDGEFYNFILADHAINRKGKTSYKSFGWWAARGVWSMSLGCRIFKTIDPQLSDELRKRVGLTFPYIDELLKRYDTVKNVGQFRVPQWLVYQSGADVSSELMLGLTEYYCATGEERAKDFIKRLADGLRIMQDGNSSTYPYGLHRSWETMWHMWGNGETQALAYAGTILNDTVMMRSAEKEAQGFYARLLIQGFMKEMDVAHPEARVNYEQIAYGVRPMVVGLLRLYDGTKNELYEAMAGLAASWFFGNNILHEALYDTATGRGYDGIRDSLTINKNSGAESTIEALHTLVELDNYPLAKKYSLYTKTKKSSNENYLSAVFATRGGEELLLVIDLRQSRVMIFSGKESKQFQEGVKQF